MNKPQRGDYFWVKFQDNNEWTVGYKQFDEGKLCWVVIGSDELYNENEFIIGNKIVNKKNG